MERFIVNNLKETNKLAKYFGSTLKGTEKILLHGDLGAGKTTFTRAMLKHLGVKDDVTSPTFTIMKEYDSKKFHIVHFDMYRIVDPIETKEFGFDEYIFATPSNTIVIVEWPENMGENYFDTENVINITIEKGIGDQRIFTLEK